MASVAKKYKKHVKGAYRRAASEGKASKATMTWSFNKGDLVKTSSGKVGLILSVEPSGYAELLTQDGKIWRKAAKLVKFKD